MARNATLAAVTAQENIELRDGSLGHLQQMIKKTLTESSAMAPGTPGRRLFSNVEYQNPLVQFVEEVTL